jgi:hypothetical protein
LAGRFAPFFECLCGRVNGGINVCFASGVDAFNDEAAVVGAVDGELFAGFGVDVLASCVSGGLDGEIQVWDGRTSLLMKSLFSYPILLELILLNDVQREL